MIDMRFVALVTVLMTLGNGINDSHRRIKRSIKSKIPRAVNAVSRSTIKVDSNYVTNWISNGYGWTTAVDVAPSGHVISGTGHGVLCVLSPESGDTVAMDEIVPIIRGGVKVIDSTTAIVVSRVYKKIPTTIGGKDTGLLNRNISHRGLTMILKYSLPDLSLIHMTLSDEIIPTSVAFGGDYVAVGGYSGKVKLFGLEELDLICDIDASEYTKKDIKSIAVSPKGNWIAFGTNIYGASGNRIMLYNKQAKIISILTETDKRPLALSFSPDETKLFANDAAFAANVYEIPIGEKVESFRVSKGLNKSIWKSDSEIIVGGREGLLRYKKGQYKSDVICSGLEIESVGYCTLDDKNTIVAGNNRGNVVNLSEKDITSSDSTIVEGGAYSLPTLYGMKYIPGGTFKMGSKTGKDEEEPVHTVTVNSFWMDSTEVTQEEFARLMGFNPSNYKGASHPVELVSWWEAIRYCNSRSRSEGLPEVYNELTGEVDWSAGGYRLPTEAEWEYAARAGSSSDYFWGNNPKGVDQYANFADISSSYDYRDTLFDDGVGDKTAEVASYKANKFGLYDMAGNVWEWCNDWYGVDYYKSASRDNPKGPKSGTLRVEKGGGFGSFVTSLRPARRNKYDPKGRIRDMGFRCVKQK